MSYTAFPSNTSASAPGVSDDNTKGYVVGSQWVDTSVTPRRVYICTNAATGAATWSVAGGVTAHNALTTLGWSAAGHTGTQTSVACFDGAGAAQTVQATQDGQVLTRVGGILVFATVAATVSLSVPDDKTIDAVYLTRGTTNTPEFASIESGPGSIV